MANLHFTASSAPLKSIQEIQFGLLDPAEIQEMSVAHIIYPETMVRHLNYELCCEHRSDATVGRGKAASP